MKFAQRKGSKVIWEITSEDETSYFMMNYSSSRPNSRIVTKENFKKYWNKTNVSGK